MEFESLPTTPRSEELLDQAFSRAARAGRAKWGVDAQTSMLQTASNVLADNLRNVVSSWPDFDTLDPFYYELADVLVGVDQLRQHLSEVGWAARKTKDLGREYQGRVRGLDVEAARAVRKQAFARMASVVEEVADDLEAVGDARERLRGLPEIDPSVPTIVVAGYPNVGKSSLVNTVTNARNDIASYPFTTKGVHVGHLEREYITYQIVDTPGLLDRPMAERNPIERQAIGALEYVADVVLFLLDASETCGYPLAAQLDLRDEIADRFDVPVVTVCNKADLSTAVEADYYVSLVETSSGPDRSPADESTAMADLEAAIGAAIEAIGYEPELPFERR